MTGSSRSRYVGRFAPSPTGPLHLGSLLAAVASYIDARANSGQWLLRMEDLDPPREPAGAADTILRQLESLELHWDGEVLYQSSRLNVYNAVFEKLHGAGLCYRCDCSRQRVKELNSIYDGHCRDRQPAPQTDFAVRIKTGPGTIGFNDLIQGS
ncbi:MAG: glutamate--tRNA ligase family protein, partial [Gammaproteobacteria bacterium]